MILSPISVMVARNSVTMSLISYDLPVKERAAPSVETVPKALGRMRVALDDAYMKASRELGLTPQQAELLCAAMTPTAVGELAKSLRCDRSNVSRLVDRASLRGLMKRNGGEDDGRVTVVELTAEGDRLARRFLTALEAQTSDLRARWPARRQQLTVELLNEISEALDAASQLQPKSLRRLPGATGRRTHPQVG